MRARLVLAATVAFIVVGATVLVSGALASLPREETLSFHMRSSLPPASPSVAPTAAEGTAPASPGPARARRLDVTAPVSVDVDDGFLSWAVLDRTTDQLVSSGDDVNTTESMVKAWIVADFLRRLDGEQPRDADLDAARRAIRDSDNGAAERLYRAGGGDNVIERMIDRCELTDTTVHPGWWSRTEITAVDAVRMGECLVDGTAAGPEWTDWLLDEMRQVRGTTAAEDQRPEEGFEGGRWGIIDGVPSEILEQGVSIKNGWTAVGATGSWHVSCLAVTQEWVLAVLMRYPATRDLDYGAERCASVAEQLFRAPTSPSNAR